MDQVNAQSAMAHINAKDAMERDLYIRLAELGSLKRALNVEAQEYAKHVTFQEEVSNLEVRLQDYIHFNAT